MLFLALLLIIIVASLKSKVESLSNAERGMQIAERARKKERKNKASNGGCGACPVFGVGQTP